jgi:hypothetical protein
MIDVAIDVISCFGIGFSRHDSLKGPLEVLHRGDWVENRNLLHQIIARVYQTVLARKKD